MNKILSEHIALTPIQAFLESESWAFYRGTSKENNLNCCINTDYGKGKNKEGGRFSEDALSADILMSMAFIEPAFISGLLEQCGWKDVRCDEYEVAGVQSNFWFPQLTFENLINGDSEDNHLRLAQPDGWIVGKNLLVMIEAKGMRDGAAFNYAQLAKEYLIAKQECPEQPRILLLLTDKQKKDIEKKGFINVFNNSWDELFKSQKDKWSQQKVDFINKQLKDQQRPEKNEVDRCFKILTYSELAKYAREYETQNSSSEKLAAMIANTIAWHTPKEDRVVEEKYTDKDGSEKTKKITHYKPGSDAPSIWSTMLIDLAAEETPLYEFYTGGTINKTVTEAEDNFFNGAEIPKDNPIRKAVEDLRDKVDRAYVADLYRLYCIQKYWELCKKKNNADTSNSVTLNHKYFAGKYSEYIKNGVEPNAQDCREELNSKYSELNDKFNKEHGELSGIKPSGTPNVRYLLYFYVRSLINNFDDETPGYKFLGFDNKKFFVATKK